MKPREDEDVCGACAGCDTGLARDDHGIHRLKDGSPFMVCDGAFAWAKPDPDPNRHLRRTR